MKVLIVGASGSIGAEALAQCLSHPKISRVVAFVRRELPAPAADHPKLECILMKDFSAWPDGVLQAHADAAGMIWAMGTYVGNTAVDLDYPMVFIESMTRVLKELPRGSRPPFRYVHLSGKFVRQNQEEKLWWLSESRKIKSGLTASQGLLETRALAFAKSHGTVWQTFVVKPGGVVTKNMMSIVGIVAAVTGKNWFVRNEELGAFMTYLVVDGEGEDTITENAGIVEKGRKLLSL